MHHGVAGPGSASQNRGSALEVAQDRDGHDQRVTATEVTAHDARPAGLTALGQSSGEVPYPADRGGRGHDQADDERDGPGPHGGGVGQVLGRGPGPDVAARGPVGAEVAPFDQDVGAHGRARVGEGQDRAVVPRADGGLRAAGQEGGDDGEELLLAEVTDPCALPRCLCAGRGRLSG